MTPWEAAVSLTQRIEKDNPGNYICVLYAEDSVNFYGNMAAMVVYAYQAANDTLIQETYFTRYRILTGEIIICNALYHSSYVEEVNPMVESVFASLKFKDE